MLSTAFRKSGMVAVVVTLAILTFGLQAQADDFQVTYTPTSGTACSISCLSIPPSLLTPFDATFSLPDADLLTNGTYDVSASYNLAFANEPGTLTADAIVLGGIVTDLDVTYDATFSTMFGEGTQHFDASGGTFHQNATLPVDVSSSETGTYVITEVQSPVPEPATLSLMAGGLFMLAGFVRVRRK